MTQLNETLQTLDGLATQYHKTEDVYDKARVDDNAKEFIMGLQKSPVDYGIIWEGYKNGQTVEELQLVVTAIETEANLRKGL